jgi:4-amino-4-deoxy-L-arabinose transferase-like glycosyltransferase
MNPDQNEWTPEGSLAQEDLPATWLLVGLAGIFLWRIIFSGTFNLIPDECSYWAWSRRLDLSYFDNSGMVAYLIRLSTSLFGTNTPFSVRFPFLLLSGLTTYLVYSVSLLLFNNRSQALLSALILNLISFAFIGASTAMHDNALIFFWMLALWGFVRFLKSGDPRWFYVVGAATGLAIQSKYTGVLLLPCLLMFFLVSTFHRGRLATKEPWIGALIAILFTLPIVWWNYLHDWASFYHILFIGTGSSSITKRLTDGLEYHLAQLLVVSPLFYFAIIFSWIRYLSRGLAGRDSERILLTCFGLPLILFGIMAFLGHVEANWAFMGYPPIVILALEEIRSKGSGKGQSDLLSIFSRKYLIWAVVVAVGPVLIVILHAWVGILPASLEKKLGKADRVIWETRGWDGLGRHVAALKQQGDVIAGDSYQLAALLEFNVTDNPYVRYLAPWKRPTQFDVWEPSFDNLKGRNILFVSSRPLLPSVPARASIYQNFEKVEPLPSYQVMYHGEIIREVFLYRGHNFNPFSPLRLGPRSLFYRDY